MHTYTCILRSVHTHKHKNRPRHQQKVFLNFFGISSLLEVPHRSFLLIVFSGKLGLDFMRYLYPYL